MGKSIDELTSSKLNEPIESADPRETSWGLFITEIDNLLATGQYNWAEATLHGIQTSVEKAQRVTDGQRAAVRNIEKARSERPSRRYEGYRR